MQVLRFVDDQHRTACLLLEPAQEALEPGGQFLGRARIGRQAELDQHRAQQLLGVELGADDLRHRMQCRVEFRQQGAHDGRLAGADLAADDDELGFRVERLTQFCEGPAVPPTAEIEARIGGQLERRSGDAKARFVHQRLPVTRSRGRCTGSVTRRWSGQSCTSSSNSTPQAAFGAAAAGEPTPGSQAIARAPPQTV